MVLNEMGIKPKAIELPERKEADGFEKITIHPNLGMRAVYLPDIEQGHSIIFYSKSTPKGLQFISEFEVGTFGNIVYDAGPLFEDDGWSIDYATGVLDKHMNMIYTNDVVMLENGYKGLIILSDDTGEFEIDLGGYYAPLSRTLTPGGNRFAVTLTTLGGDYGE